MPQQMASRGAKNSTSAAPVISVIIPVHNTRPYLKQCLDSVLSQTFPPLEIICIDDGSTDGSCELLQEYSEKRLIRLMENSWAHGQAWVRNQGIRVAKGEYIYFMDSDDWLEPDWLQVMHTAIENGYDCVVNFSIIDEYPNSSKRRVIKSIQWPDETGGPRPAKTCLLTMPAVWAHIYRVSFLREHNLYFPAGYKRDPYIHEDRFYQFAIYLHCREIYCFSASAYHYRQHINSTTSLDLSDRCYNYFATFDLTYDYMTQNSLIHDYTGILFHIRPKFQVDSPKTYTCCKQFFKKIAAHYKRHIEAYSPLQKFFYEAITESQSYDDYLAKHDSTVFSAYLASHFRRHTRHKTRYDSDS